MRATHGVAATFLAGMAWLSATRVRAAEPEWYEVGARIARDAGRIDIEERIAIRVGDGEREIRLWLYADRLAVPPRALSERSWRWIYPGDIDCGEIAIERVHVEGAPVDAPAIEREVGGFRDRAFGGADLVLPIEPGPARTIEVSMRARVRVPARFGRMGRDGSTLALAAPWYPIVVAGDAFRFSARHRVSIEVDGGEIWLGGEVSGGRAEAVREGPYVPALLAPRIDLWRGRVGDVEVAWASFEPFPRPPDRHERGPAGLDDPLQIDRIRLMRRAIGPAVATARWVGLPVPGRLDLLTIPSRTELAAAAPGCVLISDRFGQVFPVDEVRAFHLRALRRAALARIAQPIADAVDPPADRGWSEDLRSVVLLELDEIRRTSRPHTPDELLSAFAFHPSVDQLLYAPQIAFEDVYFASNDEPDAFRDDPTRARVPVARGRRLLESARDVLDPAAFSRFVAMVARGRRSIRDALARSDRRALARLPIWLDTPMLEVNYRLGEIRSEPSPGGFRHRIEIIREGAHRPEPVEVEVEAEGGERARAVWDGTGDRGEVMIETRGARRLVTIDPRHRLPQSPAIADGHPRSDDATTQPWRPPIFTGFTFDVLASEANLTGLLDVYLRRRYDLEHTVALRLVRTAARTGGRVRYLEHLGPKVHQNRRSVTFGGGVGVYWVHPGFGGSPIGGWAADVDLMLMFDTRSYLYDWREGVSLVVLGQATTTVREDGSVGATGRATVRASSTWAIGNLHAIVAVGHAGVTMAPVLDADRQSIGGRGGLRGFANDELLGTSVIYGVLEHRFTAVTDLALNVFHAIWAREFQLAWWLGAGAVLGAQDGRDAVGAFEAGAGLRIHYEYAGVQPGVLAIDVGVPISRWAERPPCAFGIGGACDRERIPVGFYLSVEQYH
jgi:hypothetical protein